MIWIGSRVGLTHNLKRTEAPIRWRKRLERLTERYQLSLELTAADAGHDWRQMIETARERVDTELTRWSQNLREYHRAYRAGEVTRSMRRSVRDARRAWRANWKEFLALGQALPVAA